MFLHCKFLKLILNLVVHKLGRKSSWHPCCAKNRCYETFHLKSPLLYKNAEECRRKREFKGHFAYSVLCLPSLFLQLLAYFRCPKLTANRK